jgi:hypothetical protein
MIELETLLVALLSGLGGGVLGTWLQIRHERHEAFRERQINAADDFTTGLQQALLAVRAAWSTCLDHGFMDAEQRLLIRNQTTGQVPAEITNALEHAERTLAEVQARHARIALLFGRRALSPRRGLARAGAGRS